MSYCKKIEYTLMPEKSFEAVRNCSGCGMKANFINTGCFRVNANGNRIDIWLIYQCKTCKHTWNMTVYERMNPKSVEKTEFEGFMSNSKELAGFYGTNSDFFSRNKAEVDWNSVPYHVVPKNDCANSELSALQQGDTIIIHNTYHLKVRVERLLADLFQLSRTKVKEHIKNSVFLVTTKSGNIIIQCNKMPN